MKTLFVALFSLAVFSTAFAQQQGKPYKFPWEITDQVYISDSTAAAVLAYNGDKRSLALITQEGVLAKEVPLPNVYIIGICK
jgi:hypothetical protein